MSRYYNDDGFEIDDDELYHFGILGQKWGLRRFQNKDGSLTPDGRRRYGVGDMVRQINKKRLLSAYKASSKDAESLRKKGYYKEADAVQKVADRNKAKADAIAMKNNQKPKNNSKIKIDKNLAVKALAGLAVTAAGAAVIHKMMNDGKSDRVTPDSLQKNFSSAFDSPKRTPDRVTSDSLQKNFSDAFDIPRGTTPDSLQKNFSDAFDRGSKANRSSGTPVNQHRSTDPITAYQNMVRDRVNKASAKVDKAITDTKRVNKEFDDWKKKNYKNEAEYRKDYKNRMVNGYRKSGSNKDELKEISDRIDKIFENRDAVVKKETDRIRKEGEAAARAEAERKAKEKADRMEANRIRREAEKAEHDNYLTELRQHGFKDEDDYERYLRRD
jgi:hypothetical protein